MASSIAPEEAYLLGCLYTRGSVEQTATGYSIKLRIPYHVYSPIGIYIVDALLAEKKQMALADIEKLPKIQARRLTTADVSKALRQVKKWYPPHKPSPQPLLSKDASNRWKIHNESLAEEYLDWQEKYKDRELKSVGFVLNHLRKTAAAITGNIKVDYEPSAFHVRYATIDCEIPSLFFQRLKSDYSLDVGEIYKVARIPDRIKSFDIIGLQEFVRGCADAGAHFDRMTPWQIRKMKRAERLWHVRLGVVNSNPALAFDYCRILQDKLHIPIFVINWAGIGDSRRTHIRGGRDHFAEFWVLNFKDFPDPLFYNTWKQEEFKEHLSQDQSTLAKLGMKSLADLRPCPRTTQLRKYMKSCLTLGCPHLGCGAEPLTSFTGGTI